MPHLVLVCVQDYVLVHAQVDVLAAVVEVVLDVRDVVAVAETVLVDVTVVLVTVMMLVRHRARVLVLLDVKHSVILAHQRVLGVVHNVLLHVLVVRLAVAEHVLLVQDALVDVALDVNLDALAVHLVAKVFVLDVIHLVHRNAPDVPVSVDLVVLQDVQDVLVDAVLDVNLDALAVHLVAKVFVLDVIQRARQHVQDVPVSVDLDVLQDVQDVLVDVVLDVTLDVKVVRLDVLETVPAVIHNVHLHVPDVPVVVVVLVQRVQDVLEDVELDVILDVQDVRPHALVFVLDVIHNVHLHVPDVPVVVVVVVLHVQDVLEVVELDVNLDAKDALQGVPVRVRVHAEVPVPLLVPTIVVGAVLVVRPVALAVPLDVREVVELDVLLHVAIAVVETAMDVQDVQDAHLLV